ncbi:MAG: DUF456 domain-containing protein [Alistipes sp.]|nr:DUF456 domain-containing protein [Alistipes sp.]
MDILLSISAILLVIAGIVGCVVPVIPGPALCYAGLLCAWGCSFSELSAAQMCLLAAATAAVSVADYLLPGYMARRFGGSRAGVTGATVGMIVGMIFFNLPGVVFGPFVGAVAGELLHDGSDTARAMRVGFGSFLSFVVGTGVKLAAALWIAAAVWCDIWPVFRDWTVSLF